MFNAIGSPMVVDCRPPIFRNTHPDQKRKRIVVGVVDLVLEVYVSSDVPKENRPSVEFFKDLVQRVSVLLANEGI